MKYIILARQRLGVNAPLQLVSGTTTPYESQEIAEDTAKKWATANPSIDYFVAPLETKFSAKITVEVTSG